MKTHGETLLDRMAEVVQAGEAPYRGAQRAQRAIDIHEDVDEGLREVSITLMGLDMLAAELEEAQDAAETTVKRVDTFFRENRRLS